MYFRHSNCRSIACALLTNVIFSREYYGLVVNVHKIASHKVVTMVRDSNTQEEDNVLQGQLKDQIYLFRYRITFCLEHKKNLKRRPECHVWLTILESPALCLLRLINNYVRKKTRIYRKYFVQSLGWIWTSFSQQEINR